jgi:RimJ/RimL family protein N-acetyltransferase
MAEDFAGHHAVLLGDPMQDSGIREVRRGVLGRHRRLGLGSAGDVELWALPCEQLEDRLVAGAETSDGDRHGRPGLSPVDIAPICIILSVSLLPPEPPLADDAIALVPMAPRHVPGIEAMLEDADVLRHTRVPSRPPPGFAKTWLARYEEGWQDGSRAGFAIESHDGEFLGLGMIVEVDWDGRQAEIGYVLGPAARGRGAATRTVRLLTDWGFEQLGMERLELWIDVANHASERVAERAGYVQEGVLRSTWFKEDIRIDAGVWSRLRTDP